MFNEIDHDRRRLMLAAAMTLVASQFTLSGFAEAQPSKGRPASRCRRERLRVNYR